MNETFIGENWNCEKCGRRMTPHGDCPHCDKIERNQAEVSGKCKRGKNIVVGDIIRPPFGFFKNCTGPTVGVIKIEITSKGKVKINGGEENYREDGITIWGEQWVDMAGHMSDYEI